MNLSIVFFHFSISLKGAGSENGIKAVGAQSANKSRDFWLRVTDSR